jgi:MFS family permease
MHLLWIDNILTSASTGFYLEFDVLYLLALGGTSALVGTRSSLNSAVSLMAPLIGAWLVARTGQRKRWVLLGGGGLGRLCMLLGALVPLAFAGSAAAWVFVGLTAAQSLFGSLGAPAGNSLFGDVVPLGVRGRFIGLQMMAMHVAHIAIVPVAGWMIKSIGGLEGYQVAIAAAALIGFWATSFYARIPEPAAREGPFGRALGLSVGFREGLEHFCRDRVFLMYCATYFVWNFGIQLSAPFFTVHMVKNLGFDVAMIALLTTTVTVVSVIAVRIAGPLVDRHGPERLTAIGMLLVPLMPLAWTLAHTPFEVFLARAGGVVAWAGVQVAATPLLLRLAPDRYRAQYIAFYTVITGVANVLGPIPASAIFSRYGFVANLLLSAAGRGIGALMFLALFLWGGLRAQTAPRASEG